MLLARLSSPLARFPFFHSRASSVFLMLLLLPRAAAPWILGDSCRMEKKMSLNLFSRWSWWSKKESFCYLFFCFRIFVCVCVFSSSFPYPSLLSIYFLSLSFSLSSILVSFSTPFCTFFSPIFSSASFFFTFPLRILDIPLLSLLFPGSFNNRIQKCIFALK